MDRAHTMALENLPVAWQEPETKQQMVQIVHSASAYLLASLLQSPRVNARSRIQVLPPMLPYNPPDPVVEPIDVPFLHSILLPIAARLAVSWPVRLQLAVLPQNLDFGLVEVHPILLQSVVVAAALALAATLAVAACLAALSSELPGTFAARLAGVPSQPVDLAAWSEAAGVPVPPSASRGKFHEQVSSLALLAMSSRHGSASPTLPPRFA